MILCWHFGPESWRHFFFSVVRRGKLKGRVEWLHSFEKKNQNIITVQQKKIFLKIKARLTELLKIENGAERKGREGCNSKQDNTAYSSNYWKTRKVETWMIWIWRFTVTMQVTCRAWVIRWFEFSQSEYDYSQMACGYSFCQRLPP